MAVTLTSNLHKDPTVLLIKNSALTYRYEIEKDLGKDATGEQVLDHIFGTYDTDYRGSTDFVIYTWVSCW